MSQIGKTSNNTSQNSVASERTPIRERLQKTNSDNNLTVKVERKKSVSPIKSKGTISIKEMLSPKEDDDQLNSSDLPKEPFSEEKMQDLWSKYAYSIRNEDIEFFGTLTKRLPILLTNFQIQLTVINDTQVNDLNKHKPKLLDYLRKQLKNYSIDIVTHIDYVASADIAYTPQQKFQKMLEKNAALEQLKNELNLDF